MGRIKIMDTTLRDAHQSLWATRMTTAEMLPIAEKMDRVGYWSMEVWGGATFDVCLRYLKEDPWERLVELRKRIKRTKLQMLLRGQNIVGYRNYPDDVLRAFVERAAEAGIGVFRIFDALNDVRNLAAAIRFVKKVGKHAQGTICYTTSPVHTVEHYVECAKRQLDEGIDSICIKDMAGILSPRMAYELVLALKEELGIPVHLHCHATSGMAVAAYLKAIEAGVDIIDTAHGPLSFYSSQPAVETIVAMLQGTEWDPGLDVALIEEISNYFEQLRRKRGFRWEACIDGTVTIHQIPGGMVTNLIRQLEEQRALDRLPQVLAEVPRVRADLGYPPLVTPTSQLVGVQAVLNVLSGERYKIVPQEVKDYVKGLYGEPPGEIDPQLRRRILGDEEPIDVRPADLLEPGLSKAAEEIPPEFVEKEEDIITYALFPHAAMEFFKHRESAPKEGPPSPRPAPPQAPGKSPASPSTDIASTVKELVHLARQYGITELVWEEGEVGIKLQRDPASDDGNFKVELRLPRK